MPSVLSSWENLLENGAQCIRFILLFQSDLKQIFLLNREQHLHGI